MQRGPWYSAIELGGWHVGRFAGLDRRAVGVRFGQEEFVSTVP